jgi:hypothetical protein
MLRKAFVFTLTFAISVLVCGKAAEGGRDLNPISSQTIDESFEEFSVLLQKLVTNPPADCSGPMHDSAEAFGIEAQLFRLVSSIVLEAINKDPARPAEAARAALARCKAVRDGETSSWESGKRLRYEVLSIQPLLVLRLAIWNQETFVVYASLNRGLNAVTDWAIAQTLDEGGHATYEHVELFPLWRGPSGNPRFLEVKHFSTCIWGMTLDYVVNGYEWHPDESSITKILAKESASSRHGSKWKLDTSGKTVAIPYCWPGLLWFTSIDSPICSLDTYDLSGDVVRFLRVENDPEDLALVARIIEYAGNHDVEALSTMCISPQIARQLTEIMPPKPIFSGYHQKSLGPDLEQLDLFDGWEMKITLKRQHGRWRVAAVKVEN